jgi:hypothetical protein
MQEPDEARLLSDVIAEAPPLARHGANQHSEKGGPDAIRSSPKDYGTSAAYQIGLIKRDRPDIAARMAAGIAILDMLLAVGPR